MILCTRSEYFFSLYGSNSRFSENTQSVIELKDDPPLAVEAMLAELYALDYVRRAAEGMKRNACFHLDVCYTANKYLMLALTAKASQAARTAMACLTDINAIIEVLQRHARYGGAGQLDEIDSDIAQLKAKNLQQLNHKPDFQCMLAEDDKVLKLISNGLTLLNAPGQIMIQCLQCRALSPDAAHVTCRNCSFMLKSEGVVLVASGIKQVVVFKE